MSEQKNNTAKTADQSKRVQRAKKRFMKDLGMTIAAGAVTAAFTVSAGVMVFSGGQTFAEGFGQSKSNHVISSGEMSASEKGLVGFILGAFAGVSGLITLVASGKAHNSHHRAEYVREIVRQEYVSRDHN